MATNRQDTLDPALLRPGRFDRSIHFDLPSRKGRREIIDYYLGEKPSLGNVDTLRCWLDDEREEVLDRIDELVVKPVEGSGGYGIVFGPDATSEELNVLARKVRKPMKGLH